MTVAVIDAGIVVGWIQRRPRSLARIDALLASARAGKVEAFISVVNVAEVLIHTAQLSRETGVDPLALLAACRVRVHSPDESIARRVARLHASIADGFAAATAMELGARLHTTDAELVRRLRPARLPISHY